MSGDTPEGALPLQDEAGREVVVRFENIWKAFGRNIIYEGLDLDVRRGVAGRHGDAVYAGNDPCTINRAY